jgi:hypothetical protein
MNLCIFIEETLSILENATILLTDSPQILISIVISTPVGLKSEFVESPRLS